jgi:hypothetical protein
MRVHFHGFWRGFIDGNDPVNADFFLQFLSTCLESPVIIGSHADADILVESVWATSNSLNRSKPWKYSFFFTGESFFSFPGMPSPPFKDYTAILGFRATHQNFIAIPLFIVYKSLYPDRFPPVTSVPKYSVGAVIGNHNGVFRNRFLDTLEPKLTVSYGGSFRNNIGTRIGGTHAGDELIRFYRNFKFVVSMENSQEEYYITEKLYNAMRAGIVPVYWGSPNVTKYFNPNRFLHVRSEYDIEVVIHRMLTMNDEEYLSMVQQPIFIEGVDGYADAVRDTKSLIAAVSQG